MLSNLINKIKPSATLAVAAKAQQLKSQGADIINLSTGEPDFDTPQHIKDAAIQAITQGKTKYTAVDGTIELKQAIINKFSQDNNLSYKPEQILVSSGAKQSIFNLMQALLNPEDEVLIPAPYWVSYPDMVKLSNGTPVIIPTTIEQQFKITPESLAKAITPKTKLIIFNSPSNPSGITYTKEELIAIAQVLEQNPHVYIVSDDIYEKIIWSEYNFHNILTVNPKLYGRTIVVNGVSKAYAMTGWRIGYASGPVEIIKAMKKVQSQSTSNPCSISQAAAVAALNGEQQCVTKMCNEFKKRHDFIIDSLKTIPNATAIKSHGTFYSLINFQQAISKLSFKDDIELSSYLLEKGVALVPGSAFGAPGYLRLSYAASQDNITKAMDRIAIAIG
jgi:aspartate aminotransferase